MDNVAGIELNKIDDDQVPQAMWEKKIENNDEKNLINLYILLMCG